MPVTSSHAMKTRTNVQKAWFYILGVQQKWGGEKWHGDTHLFEFLEMKKVEQMHLEEKGYDRL